MPADDIGCRAMGSVDFDSLLEGFWLAVSHVKNLACFGIAGELEKNAPFHQIAIITVPFVLHLGSPFAAPIIGRRAGRSSWRRAAATTCPHLWARGAASAALWGDRKMDPLSQSLLRTTQGLRHRSTGVWPFHPEPFLTVPEMLLSCLISSRERSESG